VSVRLGEWVHVGLVVNVAAKSAEFYTDGTMRARFDLEIRGARLWTNPAGLIGVGTIRQLSSHYFHGMIDELGVYRGALRDQEVASLYAGRDR
jgi:catechol 2,3-dioxygenase-like lactoylglutathione lyase family enzyme